jgi:cyclopropane fatty-acyl-phospholipid synthase-like methyltransferase
VLFDLPGVVAGADLGSLGDRVEVVGGDFFEAVPGDADAYVMKHIIHDWSDEQCVKILRNIAASMDPDGRVLVVEIVMPESDEAHPAKFMDVNMLAMTEGGSERTESEYAALFGQAGLRLIDIHPTQGIASVIEATHA